MKFILTESKLEQIIFMYLDNQDFVKVEGDNNVYFINSMDDEYAQIEYDKDDGWCIVSLDLIKEISSFFSLKSDDSEMIIGKWVENTLQMDLSYTVASPYISLILLKTPK